VTAVEAAFRALGLGLADPPATLAVHGEAGTFHVKAGILKYGDRPYFASKTNGNFPNNPTRFGLPTIQGILILSDAEDGRVLAVMDSAEITALRTAAATAVAARYLARPDASVVTICGCGVQGRVQLRALAEVLPIARVFAYDADYDRANAYAREMSDLMSLPVEAVGDLTGAVMRSDVVVTCTTASDFILHAAPAGAFIAGVGVDNDHKRELAPGLLGNAAKVVTDLRTQCAVIGDLQHAVAARAMDLSDVHADLGDVVAGRCAGRESDDEVIVFDSTGLAIQDVAAAAAVYENAQVISLTEANAT
jgi:ornithine cyclodeaminase/alanine dehydrogenase-like protein (mu-crystallin family)